MRCISIPLLALAVGLAASGAAAQGMGRHFFDNWDLNEDGKVTLDEIVEKRSDVFSTFDSDDDGVLTAEEFDMLDEARATHQEMMAEERAERRKNAPGHGAKQGGGHGKRLGDEAMNRKLLDADGDGKVSREEFIDISLDWLTGLDKTGDGVVTPADFARQ